jgi:spore germination cell wall hydrolase CwlJ-like protein
MKLALILWLSSLLPQPVADSLCLATTIYLEARNQSEIGQQAVAEVALRRVESGRWGATMCEVVTAPKQFAPTIVSPNFRLKNRVAWERAVTVALKAQREWARPKPERRQLVPGAYHFVVLDIASPVWAQGVPVAQIGDHTFYRRVASL